MKIGYIVEGDNDEAFLYGLKQRWCPNAEMEALAFRGALRHRDYRRILIEARLKNMDIVVFLTDSNTRDWNTVLTEERQQLSKSGGEEDNILLGVAKRNIECWLCADVDYIARKLGCDRTDIQVEDPKQPFYKAMGIRRDDKKKEEVAALVYEAPSLKTWLSNSRSFKHFYEEVRAMAARRNCQIPDELAGSRVKSKRNR